MADVTLESHLKSDAGVKAARKKLAQAKAAVEQLSNAPVPSSAGTKAAESFHACFHSI